MANLNVISICGSLRKGSYNRIVMNMLPGFAPEAAPAEEPGAMLGDQSPSVS